jgi:hypothetical protein
MILGVYTNQKKQDVFVCLHQDYLASKIEGFECRELIIYNV